MSTFNSKDYVITTKSGYIPYVIDDSQSYFKKARKICLDDLLFKDSFYDKNGSECICKYVGTDLPIIIGYRNTPKILISKKGHYKLTEERYTNVLKQMQASHYFDFPTGKLIYNESEVYEPKDLDDFINCTYKIVGTQFINDLIEKGMLLYIKEDKLVSMHLNETDLEYQKYMLSIKEMGAFTFISEHNYKVFHDYIENLNAKN